jgi:hypothetical protein
MKALAFQEVILSKVMVYVEEFIFGFFLPLSIEWRGGRGVR